MGKDLELGEEDHRCCEYGWHGERSGVMHLVVRSQVEDRRVKEGVYCLREIGVLQVGKKLLCDYI